MRATIDLRVHAPRESVADVHDLLLTVCERAGVVRPQVRVLVWDDSAGGYVRVLLESSCLVKGEARIIGLEVQARFGELRGWLVGVGRARALKV